jgi:outer membrane immunogenic protein
MQRIIGGLVVSALLIAAPLSIASAADMALKAPPPVPAPVYNWTGCYVGGNGGGLWTDKSYNWSTQRGFPTGGLNAGSLSADSWAFGGQVGCDYQVSNYFVVGIRGMVDGTNVTGSNVWPVATANSNSLKIGSFETVVAKLGVVPIPAVEFYVVVGAALVQDQYSVLTAGSVVGTANQTNAGVDVGGGFSWMFARNWDLFVEYDYMAFGTKNVIESTYGLNVEQNVSKVLVGIDYRFD